MRAPTRLALLLLATALSWPRAVDCRGLEQVVHPDLQHCCSDEPRMGCPAVDAVTKGQDGFLHLFARDKAIRALVDAKGFPEVRRGWTVDSKGTWFPEGVPVTGEDRPRGALLLGSWILLSKGGRFYRYSAPMRLNSTGSNCRNFHSLFCPRPGLELVGSLASTARGRDGRQQVQGYYFQPETGSYLEAAFEGSALEAASETRAQVRSLTAVTLHRERLVVFRRQLESRGLLFDAAGNACPFAISPGQTLTDPDADLSRPPTAPRLACLSTQVFWGCPQSWCFRPDVDDILATSGRRADGSFAPHLIVYRGHYH